MAQETPQEYNTLYVTCSWPKQDSMNMATCAGATMVPEVTADKVMADLSPSDGFRKAWEALNLRQKRFFAAYWRDECRSATRAAKAAGYSPKHAASQGSLILHSAAGRQVMKLWLDEIGVTPDSIMAEFHRINNASLYDFRDLFQGKSLEDLHAAGIDLRQIRKMKIKTRRKVEDGAEYEVQEIEIELYDRLKALVTQAKLLKMFGDDGDGLGAAVVLDMLEAASDRIRTRPADVEAAVKAAENMSKHE